MCNKRSYSKDEANKVISFSSDDVTNNDVNNDPTLKEIDHLEALFGSDNTCLSPDITMELLHRVIKFGSFYGKCFESICCGLIALHERKNKDYGDSFTKTMDMFGIIALCIRLNDKLSRLISVVKNGKCEVQDESIDDTLMDLAAYAIMGLEYRYNRPVK